MKNETLLGLIFFTKNETLLGLIFFLRKKSEL